MKTIEQMVQQEVSCCLSSLVSTLANGDAQAGTDLAELCDRALGLAMPVPDYEKAAIQGAISFEETDNGWYWRNDENDARGLVGPSPTKDEAAREACQTYHLDPVESEVAGHWAVSPWLAEKLVAQGEKVDTNFAGLNVWARRTKDQPISADNVIVRLYSNMMKG